MYGSSSSNGLTRVKYIPACDGSRSRHGTHSRYSRLVASRLFTEGVHFVGPIPAGFPALIVHPAAPDDVAFLILQADIGGAVAALQDLLGLGCCRDWPDSRSAFSRSVIRLNHGFSFISLRTHCDTTALPCQVSYLTQ